MIGIDAKADARAHQRSEGGRLAVLEAVDRTAEAIGLHLVEKIEPGQSPGDSDLSDSADERIDGLQALAHLDHDPLEDLALRAFLCDDGIRQAERLLRERLLADGRLDALVQ